MSQGTPCYTGNLFLEGKPFAILSNTGRGGADRYDQHPKCKLEPKAWGDTFRAIEKYIEEKEKDLDGSTLNIETWAHLQVDIFDASKSLKRLLKKHTLFIEKGVLNQSSAPSSVVSNTKIRVLHPNAKVLNTMEFDEALKIYLNN
jgi:hypothetical protein